MKQYDVEMSAIACFGYTDCKLFMTDVNLSDPSSSLIIGAAAGLNGVCCGNG